MKRDIWQRLKAPACPPRGSWWITLSILLLWVATIYARPHIIQTHCFIEPTPCTPESVWAPDRFALGQANPRADHFSWVTQNTSAAIAFGLPPLWAATRFWAGSLSAPIALSFALTDLLLMSEATVVNGVAMEVTRVVAQRPRPFVYHDPIVQGRNPAHYVSFYSGHTSFTATAWTMLFLILLARGAPTGALWLAGIVGSSFISATAVLRVLAGRHFPTDVIAGAIAGALLAIGVAWLNRPRAPLNP